MVPGEGRGEEGRVLRGRQRVDTREGPSQSSWLGEAQSLEGRDLGGGTLLFFLNLFLSSFHEYLWNIYR